MNNIFSFLPHLTKEQRVKYLSELEWSSFISETMEYERWVSVAKNEKNNEIPLDEPLNLVDYFYLYNKEYIDDYLEAVDLILNRLKNIHDDTKDFHKIFTFEATAFHDSSDVEYYSCSSNIFNYLIDKSWLFKEKKEIAERIINIKKNFYPEIEKEKNTFPFLLNSFFIPISNNLKTSKSNLSDDEKNIIISILKWTKENPKQLQLNEQLFKNEVFATTSNTEHISQIYEKIIENQTSELSSNNSMPSLEFFIKFLKSTNEDNLKKMNKEDKISLLKISPFLKEDLHKKPKTLDYLYRLLSKDLNQYEKKEIFYYWVKNYNRNIHYSQNIADCILKGEDFSLYNETAKEFFLNILNEIETINKTKIDNDEKNKIFREKLVNIENIFFIKPSFISNNLENTDYIKKIINYFKENPLDLTLSQIIKSECYSLSSNLNLITKKKPGNYSTILNILINNIEHFNVYNSNDILTHTSEEEKIIIDNTPSPKYKNLQASFINLLSCLYFEKQLEKSDFFEKAGISQKHLIAFWQGDSGTTKQDKDFKLYLSNLFRILKAEKITGKEDYSKHEKDILKLLEPILLYETTFSEDKQHNKKSNFRF